MDSYDVREILHKTIDTQVSKLLNGFSHLLNDSKIASTEGGLENAEISGFQLKIHHLTIVKALHMFLQIASDVDLGSILLKYSERVESVETVRRELEEQIAAHTGPESQLTRRVLQINPFTQQPSSFEDDDVVFEDRAISSMGEFRLNPNFATNVTADVSNIPPVCTSQNLYVFP